LKKTANGAETTGNHSTPFSASVILTSLKIAGLNRLREIKSTPTKRKDGSGELDQVVRGRALIL
jgi:hypothetical protein